MTTPAPAHRPDHIFKGIAYACAAFFLFTAMQALNKLLAGQHHVVEIAFYRNFLAILPCLIYIGANRRYDLLRTDMPGTLFVRVVVGTIGLLLTFAATQYLPIANATVLFFASTILTPVIAHFALREHIGLQRWSAVFFGMAGVVLVAQPSAEMTVFGAALALGAACTHAIIQVTIRAMKRVEPFTITFYFFLGGFVGPGLAMPWFYNPLTAHSALILLAIGITGGLGQYFLTRGFQIAPASLLSPFNYTGLLWATLFDVMIWHYVPGWPVFAGSAIIMASSLFILYRERKVAARTKQQALKSGAEALPQNE